MKHTDRLEQMSIFDDESDDTLDRNDPKKPRDPASLFARKQKQSQQKHDILAYYLEPWAKIVTAKFPRAVYVDTFAGPGLCQSGDACSPVLAAQTLSRYKDGKASIQCINVEKRREHYEALVKNMKPFEQSIEVVNIHGSFQRALPDILSRIRQYQGGCASFFFIDPYGFKDVRFVDIKEILDIRHSEALVHFPYNGLIRGLGVLSVHQTIDEYYGKENVASDLSAMKSSTRRDLMVSQFEQQFRDIGCYTIAFRIDMPRADRPYFYLIYMTREPVGLMIMRDAWRAHERKRLQGQLPLISSLDGPTNGEALCEFLVSQFRGHTVSRKEALAKAMMHHDVTRREVESALETLGERGQLSVKQDYRRRKDYDSLEFR